MKEEYGILVLCSVVFMVRNTCSFLYFDKKKASGEQTEEMKNGEVNTPEIKSETVAAPTETIGKGNQDDETGYHIIYLANYHKNLCISCTFLLKYWAQNHGWGLYMLQLKIKFW